MHIKSQKDFWSGLLFVVAGTTFAIGSTAYNFGSSARPGPGYFPLGLGVLLALLGAVVLFKALMVPTRDGEPIGAIAWRPLCVVVASILVFAFALPRLGLALALPLLVALISAAGDRFDLRGVVLSAAVLTVGSWAIFIKGLGLVIPLWPAFLD